MVALHPPPKVPFTYREYCYLPDDGRRYELVNGELYVTPAPAPFHQTVSRRLQYALMTALENTGDALVFNAPCDVILDERTVVQPDLVIVRKNRKSIISERGIEAPPDVVVEILSPSTKGQDIHLKRATYAHFSIPEYWIVDADLGRIDVFTLREDGYHLVERFDRASTLRSPSFEQISIPLEPVFQPH